MRLDKFLWTVRIYKTRSLAIAACKSGKIRVNTKETKSAAVIKPGDLIQYRFLSGIKSLRVIALPASRVSAKLVEQFVADETPDTEKEKMELYKLNQQNYSANENGRPTKKDRRKIRGFNDSNIDG